MNRAGELIVRFEFETGRGQATRGRLRRRPAAETSHRRRHGHDAYRGEGDDTSVKAENPDAGDVDYKTRG